MSVHKVKVYVKRWVKEALGELAQSGAIQEAIDARITALVRAQSLREPQA